MEPKWKVLFSILQNFLSFLAFLFNVFPWLFFGLWLYYRQAIVWKINLLWLAVYIRQSGWMSWKWDGHFSHTIISNFSEFIWRLLKLRDQKFNRNLRPTYPQYRWIFVNTRYLLEITYFSKFLLNSTCRSERVTYALLLIHLSSA